MSSDSQHRLSEVDRAAPVLRKRHVAVDCLCLAVTALFLFSSCAPRPNGDEDDVPIDDFFWTDFPVLDYGYGHKTHLLFSFDGSPEEASTVRRVSEKGISDDPRVQQFVNRFRETLAARQFTWERTLWRQERGLSYLSEPTYYSGLRVSDAHAGTRARDGRSETYYQWKDIDGRWLFGAFENDLGTRVPVTSSLECVYGRPSGPRTYTDFLKLSVQCSTEGPAGRNSASKRNTQLWKYGVMGIVAARTEEMQPPRLVHDVIVTISSRPGVASLKTDEVVAVALNLALGDDDVLWLYPAAALEERGDSNDRVQYYAQSVDRAVTMKAQSD